MTTVHIHVFKSITHQANEKIYFAYSRKRSKSRTTSRVQQLPSPIILSSFVTNATFNKHPVSASMRASRAISAQFGPQDSPRQPKYTTRDFSMICFATVPPKWYKHNHSYAVAGLSHRGLFRCYTQISPPRGTQGREVMSLLQANSGPIALHHTMKADTVRC